MGIVFIFENLFLIHSSALNRADSTIRIYQTRNFINALCGAHRSLSVQQQVDVLKNVAN
jgi:hypothetical protein